MRGIVVLGATVVLALAVSSITGLAADGQLPGQPASRLVPDQSLMVPVAEGTGAVAWSELDAGSWWRLTIASHGRAVHLRILAPSGSEALQIDTLMGLGWTDAVVWNATAGGRYRFEVTPSEEAEAGSSVELRLEPLLPAGPATLAGRQAELQLTEALKALSRGLELAAASSVSSVSPVPSASGAASTSEESASAMRHAAELAREVARSAAELGLDHIQAGALVLQARVTTESRRKLALLAEALDHLSQGPDLASQAPLLNEMGIAALRLGDLEGARSSFERAAGLWQILLDRTGEAVAHGNLCLVLLREGSWQQADQCYQQALVEAESLGDRRLQAQLLASAGGVAANLGQPERSIGRYERSLELSLGLKDATAEAQVRNNLGALYRRLGEPDKALHHYRLALEAFQRLGDRYWEARALNNLGYAYLSLGELDRARSLFLRALPIRRVVADRSGEATTLRNLARTALRSGAAAEALEYAGQALELARAARSARGEGAALLLVGMARAAAGGTAAALAELDAALALRRKLADQVGVAEALTERCDVLIDLGRPAEALQGLDEVRGVVDEVGDPAGRFRALYLSALARTRLDQPHEALAALDRALAAAEALRVRIPSPMQRATFLGEVREAHDLRIALHMKLDRREPTAGHVEAALVASEQARARVLLDLIDARSDPLDQEIDGGLLDSLRSASRRLGAAAQQQLELAQSGADAAHLAAGRAAVQAALTGLEAVEAQIRQRSPRWASLVAPQSLDAASLEAQLDPRTLLLEYALTEDQGFVWAMTSTGLASFTLPGRERIETLARRTLEQRTSVDLRTRRTSSEAACELARVVLGPVAGLLGRQRLVVVPDGALDLVPFATLPDPTRRCDASGAERLLIDDHEVVHLPSLTTLALQRRLLETRGRAGHGVAILADPILDRDDPRLPTRLGQEGASEGGAGNDAADEASAASWSALGLGRLARTSDEARAIAAIAGPEQTLLALGADARRDLLFDPELARYRILHLASHGVIDPVSPELSGLVLSRFDRDGRPLEPMVRLHDLLRLRLRADLVVLSGCRTALGRQIRGEGMVGLARGFMYAGVPRVVSSLWQVQDETTASLMERFYDHMLHERMAPAAALRRAQLEIRQQRGREDPYYWGAFVFQGDWR